MKNDTDELNQAHSDLLYIETLMWYHCVKGDADAKENYMQVMEKINVALDLEKEARDGNYAAREKFFVLVEEIKSQHKQKNEMKKEKVESQPER